ncbi:metal-dependent hydrolase [Chondrinema litorale]|uniref:metal-dependent hydrolase n=1 Tax=Chondrinema litorale TaxID=2994555 RepID=UPI002543D111|nr:metal-dependent hydrolase [Chondrinema litorale]UZR92413.1 metal-dependent hydrolase [Chondrinema litorale]
MKLTYYGHSCFSVNLKGKEILFDPFISGNELASDVDIASLKPDYILLSHGHSDHTADAEQIAKQSGATIVSNFEVVSWFGNKGLEKVHPMNHGGSWKFDFGTVKYVNAVHSSSMPDGSYGGNPGGFIISNDEITFYFAGDTALTLDMQLIPRFHKLDLAILPIGDNFTMNVDEAIVASDFIECNKVVGVHYDTFGYIKIDHEASIEKFANASKELFLPKIGESLDF